MPALNPGDPGYRGNNNGWNPNNWSSTQQRKNEQAAAVAAAAQKLNGNKMPHQMGDNPEEYKWEGQLGPDGSLRRGLKLEGSLNTDYLTGLRENALRDAGTPSAWRGLQQEKINRQAGDVSAQMAGQQRQQLDAMAMRGGVGAGAAERMGQQGVGQALRAQQDVYSQGLQADMTDEQNRLTGLQNLGQAELGAANFNSGVDQFNIKNTLQEIAQKRLFDANKYKEQSAAWAAKNTAQAAPSSGGGGLSVICTALHTLGKISKEQYKLNTDWGKKVPVEIFAGYLTWASPIAAKMLESKLFAKLLAPIFMPVSNEMAAVESDKYSSTLLGKAGLNICVGISIVAGKFRRMKKSIKRLGV